MYIIHLIIHDCNLDAIYLHFFKTSFYFLKLIRKFYGFKPFACKILSKQNLKILAFCKFGILFFVVKIITKRA